MDVGWRGADVTGKAVTLERHVLSGERGGSRLAVTLVVSGSVSPALADLRRQQLSAVLGGLSLGLLRMPDDWTLTVGDGSVTVTLVGSGPALNEWAAPDRIHDAARAALQRARDRAHL